MMMVQSLGFPPVSFSPTTPPQPQEGPADEADRTPPPSFHCRHGGCTKVFRRKEHLNRHERSHESMRPHKCYLCNKSFARKDILHRHVLLHNAPPGEGPKRTLLACKTCRRRKIRCDSNESCSACEAAGVRCVRTPSSSQNVMGRRQQQRPGAVQGGPSSQDSNGSEDENSCEDDAQAQTEQRTQYDYFGSPWSPKPDSHNITVNPTSGGQNHYVQSPIGENMCSPTTGMSPSWSWSGNILHGNQTLPSPPSEQAQPCPVMTTESIGTPESLTTPTFYMNSGPLALPWSGAPSGYGDNMQWQSKDSYFMPTSAAGDVPGMGDMMVWSDQAQLETFFHGLWPLLHLPTMNMETATPAFGTW
jgi:hypothetical protein